MSNYNTILTSVPKSGVKLITLNRPKALNALNSELVSELVAELKASDADATIGAIVVTGSERAFAAGADIKEMAPKTNDVALDEDFLANWAEITTIKKPIVAAVSGYALGGGLEIAMACDIIYATEKSKFGQPEINLGVIPGGGGSQRLIRAIGKSKAMEYILTGEQFTAQQAEAWGLISKTFANNEELMENALNLASKLNNSSRLAIKSAKKAVNSAYELSLTQGLDYERLLFQALFGTESQKEGMAAFLEKRKPSWSV